MPGEIIYGIDPALESSKTIMVVSTPNGAGNKFFEMMTESLREDFTNKWLNILDAPKSDEIVPPRITINKQRRQGANRWNGFILDEMLTWAKPELHYDGLRPLANILAFWDYDSEIDWRPNVLLAEDYYV